MTAARRFAELSTSEPPTGQSVLFSRAVVLGGSIAGLMAARVLSDHAGEVVMVEPDDLASLDVPDEVIAADPAGAVGPRPGVPQGSHVHTLLPSGLAQLERWFPGFAAAALAAGAVTPPPGTSHYYLNGRLREEAQADPRAQPFVSSRPFLEALIRNRVLARSNVRTIQDRAGGLIFEGEAVAGVRLSQGAIGADFVVDATGRSSRLGDWTAGHGFPKPPMQRLGIKLNYATALFHRPADPPVWTCLSVVNPGSGQLPRIGTLIPIEGDRWTMLVSGYDTDRPGRSTGEFRRRCESDYPAEFTEVITYHQADSRRRDFHRLRRFPARLVAVGDAVASFNPVYGQGMTSAMLHASALSEYLRGRPDPARPARSYFAAVKIVVDAAWQISAMGDLALPHIDGPYPKGYRALQWVSGMIFKASARDPRVGLRLGQVYTMSEHPSALAEPRFLMRALAAGSRA